MTALADAVVVRISADRIFQLTNPDLPAATTVNTTRLEAAVTDAAAQFYRIVGQAFDQTSSEHLAVGVKGVVAFLEEYRGLPGDSLASAARQEWLRALTAYRHTRGGSAAPVSPATNSNLSPSREDNTGTVRPAFDGRNMADLVPNDPRGGGHAFDEDDF